MYTATGSHPGGVGLRVEAAHPETGAGAGTVSVPALVPVVTTVTVPAAGAPEAGGEGDGGEEKQQAGSETVQVLQFPQPQQQPATQQSQQPAASASSQPSTCAPTSLYIPLGRGTKDEEALGALALGLLQPALACAAAITLDDPQPAAALAEVGQLLEDGALPGLRRLLLHGPTAMAPKPEPEADPSPPPSPATQLMAELNPGRPPLAALSGRGTDAGMGRGAAAGAAGGARAGPVGARGAGRSPAVGRAERAGGGGAAGCAARPRRAAGGLRGRGGLGPECVRFAVVVGACDHERLSSL